MSPALPPSCPRSQYAAPCSAASAPPEPSPVPHRHFSHAPHPQLARMEEASLPPQPGTSSSPGSLAPAPACGVLGDASRPGTDPNPPPRPGTDHRGPLPVRATYLSIRARRGGLCLRYRPESPVPAQGLPGRAGTGPSGRSRCSPGPGTEGPLPARPVPEELTSRSFSSRKTLAVLSKEPEARRRPQQLQATECTLAPCAGNSRLRVLARNSSCMACT